MSRCCEISISVTEYADGKYDAIVDAVSRLNYEANDRKIGEFINFDLEVINIPISSTEESIAREIHEAVWRANGRYCAVNVSIRDLDDGTPSYLGKEAEYDKLIRKRILPLS